MNALLRLALTVALVCSGTLGWAQYASRNVSGTITATGTFQTVLNQDFNRKGCRIQNKSAANAMQVFVGNGTATANTSFQLAVGATFDCTMPGGGALSDAIQITGTIGDVYFAIIE